MKKRHKKNKILWLAVLLVLGMTGIFAVSAMVLAAVPPDLGSQLNANLAYGAQTGLGTRDIRAVAMTIINVILGFLGSASRS